MIKLFKLSKYIVFTNSINSKNDRIVYSTRTCKPLLLSEELYNTLIRNNFESIPHPIFNKLIEKKIIIDSHKDEYLDVVEENEDMTKSSRFLYEVIQPTSACQLDCDYCGQTKTNKILSKEHASLIINRIKRKLEQNNFKTLGIAWFGGEPLIAIEKIRSITQELKGICKEKNINYVAKMATNGVALTRERFELLVNKLDITDIEITLDGTKEYHDRFRHKKDGKGSFNIILSNLIEIAKIKDIDKKCHVTVRCNVNKFNEANIPALINLLYENQLHKKYRFYAKSIHSWAQNNADKDSLELSVFASKEIEWMKKMKDMDFNVDLGLPKRRYSSCLAVLPFSAMYDANANVYSCTEVSFTEVYVNSGYHLGQLPNVRKSEIYENWYKEIGQLPCRDCSVFPICGGGCLKKWRENKIPCLPLKYNLKDKILMSYLATNKKNNTVNNEHN